MTLIKTSDPQVLAALANAATDKIAPGPYVITGGIWTYAAADVDEHFGGADKHSFSGQFNLVVSDATGFCKVLIPADEEDGHSGGEALHALRALNIPGEFVAAFDQLLAEVEGNICDPGAYGFEITNPEHPWHDAVMRARAARAALIEMP